MKELNTAIILGSGLGKFAESAQIEKIIPYKDIEEFSVPSVEGHKGQMVIGNVAQKTILMLEGRVHFYEGHTMKEVTSYINFLKNIGIKNLIITNAAGGINETFKSGDLMAITDQITSFVPSPLCGINPEKMGAARFPDMTHVYDEKMIKILFDAAKNTGIILKKGVYLQTTGPNYETPAEIRMFRTLGADAVGMSTAVEAMVAHAIGLNVCGISLISNMAAGISKNLLSHEEVTRTGEESSEKFKILLTEFIKEADEL